MGTSPNLCIQLNINLVKCRLKIPVSVTSACSCLGFDHFFPSGSIGLIHYLMKYSKKKRWKEIRTIATMLATDNPALAQYNI